MTFDSWQFCFESDLKSAWYKKLQQVLGPKTASKTKQNQGVVISCCLFNTEFPWIFKK
jgi:hypothetical protein